MEMNFKLDGRDKVVQYKNNIVEKPLVSVSVVTYKHEKFIKQCLDGILMQKTIHSRNHYEQTFLIIDFNFKI